MRLAAFLITCALALSSTALAREITPAERREEPFDAKIPLCHDPSVLEEITSHFAEREVRFWNSGLKLVQYENIKPVAWRPWGLDYIPRRYCTATVLANDGRKRRVDYVVRDDLDFGFPRQTWDVLWCVAGLDRHFAFAPNCRMARP